MSEPPPWEDDAFAGTLIPGAAARPPLHVMSANGAGLGRSVATTAAFRATERRASARRAAAREAARSRTVPDPDDWERRRAAAAARVRAERRGERVAAGLEAAPAAGPLYDLGVWVERHFGSPDDHRLDHARLWERALGALAGPFVPSLPPGPSPLAALGAAMDFPEHVARLCALTPPSWHGRIPELFRAFAAHLPGPPGEAYDLLRRRLADGWPVEAAFDVRARRFGLPAAGDLALTVADLARAGGVSTEAAWRAVGDLAAAHPPAGVAAAARQLAVAVADALPPAAHRRALPPRYLPGTRHDRRRR